MFEIFLTFPYHQFMLEGLKISAQDQRWLDRRVDIFKIRENLKLSYEQRIVQLQQTLNSIQALRGLGSNCHARPRKTP